MARHPLGKQIFGEGGRRGLDARALGIVTGPGVCSDGAFAPSLRPRLHELIRLVLQASFEPSDEASQLLLTIFGTLVANAVNDFNVYENATREFTKSRNPALVKAAARRTK
jgi:hypothetical protein